MDEKVTYVAAKSDVASVVTKPERIKSIAENLLKIRATITITNADATLVQNFLFDLLEKGLRVKFVFDTAATKTATKNELQVNLFDANLYISKASLDLLLLLLTRTQNFLYRVSWSTYRHTWDWLTIIKISPASIMTKKYQSDSEY
jgi:hypothetical protein